jgi:hypothetical protein
MVEEAEMLDDTRSSFVASILKDGTDHGLKRCCYHFRCLAICSIVAEDDVVDSEFVSTTCEGVVTQDLVAENGPMRCDPRFALRMSLNKQERTEDMASSL